VGRQVRIPVVVAALLVVALAVASVQGVRMARDRFQRLQPSRVTLWLAPAEGERTLELTPGVRFLVADLAEYAPARRIGLYQAFPERTLVRWIEPADHQGRRWLVVPLEGLDAGDYLLTEAPADAAAQPREMDLPTEELAVIGRFRLVWP
jgi:hypothetical protein